MWVSIPMAVGQCANKGLRSDIPVEVGVGEPCDSKDTRDIVRNHRSAMPEKGHVGIRASPTQKVTGSLAN